MESWRPPPALPSLTQLQSPLPPLPLLPPLPPLLEERPEDEASTGSVTPSSKSSQLRIDAKLTVHDDDDTSPTVDDPITSPNVPRRVFEPHGVGVLPSPPLTPPAATMPPANGRPANAHWSNVTNEPPPEDKPKPPAATSPAGWSPNTRMRLARLLSSLHGRAIRGVEHSTRERNAPQRARSLLPSESPRVSRLRTMLQRSPHTHGSRMVAIGPE